MLEITDITFSKNTCRTGETFIISVGIEETTDHPYDFPYDFPISYTGVAMPEK